MISSVLVLYLYVSLPDKVTVSSLIFVDMYVSRQMKYRYPDGCFYVHVSFTR